MRWRIPDHGELAARIIFQFPLELRPWHAAIGIHRHPGKVNNAKQDTREAENLHQGTAHRLTSRTPRPEVLKGHRQNGVEQGCCRRKVMRYAEGVDQDTNEKDGASPDE